MIGAHSRTARRIAGGGTGAPEYALNDAANDWASSLGRSSRPPHRIPRGPETEIAWRVAFSGCNLTGGKPNGECRINIAIPTPWTGTLVGWSGTASVNRYGDVFWSPAGAGIGKTLTFVSASLTANWLNQDCVPSQTKLADFLSGNGFNAALGFWGGVSESYTPGSGFSTGIGLVTPQAGISYNYSFHGGNIGVQW